MARATISDVSRAAGVSTKTVSRVLNKERYVNAATRAKVEAAMAALDFHPSLAARALAGGRSFLVTVICANPSPYYLHAVLAGARARCADEGVRVMLHPYDIAARDLASEIANLIDQTCPEGVILTPPVSDAPEVLALLDDRGVRVARIQPGTALDEGASVYIDNRQAAAAMTRRLLALGHRRIGFVAGHPGYAVSAQRLEGHRVALAEAGVTGDAALVRPGQFDVASGRKAARALLDLAEPPSAIFAASDDMAAGVIAEAHRRGLRLPQDLSVAGFDDTDLASAVWPALTTIRQPVRDLAWAAADLLFSGGAGEQRRELAFALVERDSTGWAD